MTNKVDISGSDYSFFLQSIDGRITSASSNPESASVAKTPNMNRNHDININCSLSTIGANTSAKRRRISELVDIIGDSDVDVEIGDNTGVIAEKKLTYPPNSRSTSNMSSSAASKMQIQIDELKLINEQQKEQLLSYKSEHGIFKEQSARQLKFLEEQNSRLKNESEQRLQKYYEEKKKWLSKVRELEQQYQDTKNSQVTKESGVSTLNSLSSTREVQLQRQINELENMLVEKQKEVSHHMSLKCQTEKRLFEAEQSLKVTQSDSSSASENIVELRLLRKQCADLESSLRRKSRELEKLGDSAKNQTMLEEELNSALTKLNLAQETIKTYQNMEIEYRRILEERKTWAQIFSTVMREQQSSIASCEEDITPVKALNVLNDLRQKYALLQSSQADLERGVVNLRQSYQRSENRVQELEREKMELSDRLERVLSKQTMHSNQAKLYESEIQSLRSLMKTFDFEFSIGKPDISKVNDLKNELIESLRSDLDSIRKETVELYATKASLSSSIEDVQKQLEAAKFEAEEAVSKLKIVSEKDSVENNVSTARYDELLADYEALQEYTGVDFLPHKTKVLHMALNPSSAITKGKGSSIPMDVIKFLREENQELKTKVVAPSEAEKSHEDISANSSMNDPDNRANHNQLNVSSITAGNLGQADPAKLNQRLKEMFKEKISTFRNAVYELTGYKMDMTSSEPGSSSAIPRIKLRPMYAESPEDYLLFQLTESGPELLDSELINKLDPTLMQCLTQYNSFPAFLANVTITLFDNQTFMG